jgi:deoxycytidine triphosphate deaminase
MVRCADYIWNNIIIADEVNTTKKYAKKAQCGVDLSVKSLKRFTDMGYTLKDKTFAAPTKEVEKVAVTAPNGNVVYGYKLEPGTYALELNEGCKLGPNDTAYVIMRSSLNRSGAHCHSALWDPQFTTQSGDNIYPMNIRMTVDNQHGFFIEENARVAQIVVFENEDTEGYDGQWQGGATVSKLV